MLINILYLLLALLPLARTIPSNPLPHVECGTLPARSVDAGDCIVLLANIESLPATSQRITYGRMQRPPGKVPHVFEYDDCMLRVDAFAFQPIRNTDTFRLSDYMPDIRRVVDECLGPGSPHQMGTVLVGGRKRFFAWLGGRPLERGTGTVGEVRDVGDWGQLGGVLKV